MTVRYIREVPTDDRDAAIAAAKALAKAAGYRVRTVSRIVQMPGITRVELAVDDAPTTDVGTPLAAGQGGGGVLGSDPARPSWVSEARADALAWRAERYGKGNR